MIEIQVALDRMPLTDALRVTRQVAGVADGVEVGTSLIKRYGMRAVAEVLQAGREVDPRLWVLADLKTADDAEYELTLAYDAGATSATVLGLASEQTLSTAVRVAAERGAELVVDLMLLDEPRRAALSARLPHDVRLAAHVGKDEQQGGASPLDQLGPWASGRRLAVAGGLGVRDVPAIRDVPNLRLIVGSAITRAADPAEAVAALDAARRAHSPKEGTHA